jgi:ABC-type oligopeptide transport system substrate-binding subunit
LTIEKNKQDYILGDEESKGLVENWRSNAEQMALFAERTKGFSRRFFLGVVGTAAGSAFLAACGASATNTPAAGSATTAAARPTTAVSGSATTAPAGSATTAAVASGSPIPGVGTGKEELAAEQVFKMPFTSEPTSHDFNKDLYCAGFQKLFAGLLTLDPDLNPKPYAAEKFEVKNNGATYVFYLNPKGTWSNGDAVTAEDFVWSFTRQLTPETKASYAAFLYDIKGAESFNTGKGGTAKDLGLKALDKYTLEVTLEGPRGYFPILAAYAAALPAHKPSVEKFADKWTEAENIVTNGPFRMTKWDHNKEMIFERFEKFEIAPKPKLQKIISPIIANSTGILPYENNEVDFRSGQGVPATEIPRITRDEKLSKDFMRFSGSGLWYLEPVGNKPPFDNLQVRLALRHAVDRVQMGKILQGLGEPAYTLLPPDIPGAIDPKKYPELASLTKFDPQMAKDMLKGTPYEGAKNWPAIKMNMREEGATAKLMAEFVQSQLKSNLNMDITIEATVQQDFRGKLYENKHQFVFIRWYMDYPDANNFYYQVFYSKAPSGKRHFFSNDKYDDLVAKAAAETDQEKRYAMYRDAEKMLLENGAYSPLVYAYVPGLIKPYVKGLPLNKAGQPMPDWNMFVSMTEYLYITKK